MRMVVVSSVLALALLSGCARYEYDLVEPAALARHIGTKHDERVELEPLAYILRSYENRLVMRIENPTNDPIELLGPQSIVVSPDGQSHPLRSQTIAPASYIKLILPPMRPPVGRWGPSIGIGVGAHVEREEPKAPERDVAAGGGGAQPVYLQIEDSLAYYWDWEGETDARLLLSYRRDEQAFQHRFVFHRRKM